MRAHRAVSSRRVPSLDILVALLGFMISSCTAGEVELYEPEGSGLASGLTVKVELDSAAADIAETLGWTAGVPDAEVRVHRTGTEFRWETALTDSAGEARFPDLIPGRYRLAAYRALSDEEVAELGGRRRAFADGRMVELSEPRTVTLTAAPDQRGCLLISELYGTSADVLWGYLYHFYLEVYNNSDTTIYLDGKILGLAYYFHDDSPSGGWTCAHTEMFRDDPGGVWSRTFHQFPGSGAEYPLAPGEIALVALDAVDHSHFYAVLPDLSGADFELLGYGDVDNPAVPNMPEVGLESWFWGHGLQLYFGRPYFLSERVDIETLPRMWDEWGHTPRQYIRFPREALLDVLATRSDYPLGEQNYPPCSQDVHRNFDRLAGVFTNDPEYSIERLVIGTTSDGWAILQDTNTTAVDFVLVPHNPGRLRGNGSQ
jgi:hypothetical protein